MAIDKSNASSEKQPLHKSSGGPVDAGKTNDGKETTILKPSQDMHATKPGPGNEVPGQVAKM